MHVRRAVRSAVIIRDLKGARYRRPLVHLFPVAMALLACLSAASPASAGSITKKQARTMFETAKSQLKSDPMEKEASFCVVSDALDEAFGGATVLDERELKTKFEAAMARRKLAFEKKDPAVVLQLMRCVINSKAFEHSITSKNRNDPIPREKQASLPLLDMDDLRLDITSLIGKMVRTQGVGHYIADMFVLKKSMTDMSPIFVDISKLPRDQRRQLMQRCGDIITGCRVTVQGRVGEVASQNGVVAETIDW